MKATEPHLDPSSTELWVYGAALVIFIVLTGFSVAEAVEEEAPTAPVGHAVNVEAATPPTVESLTCFTCHSLETYRDGGEGAFPHSFHNDFLDFGNDCHLCHAFTEHTPEPVPLPDCADCH